MTRMKGRTAYDALAEKFEAELTGRINANQQPRFSSGNRPILFGLFCWFGLER